MSPTIRQDTLKRLISFQRNELTEYHIYNRLSQQSKGENNKKILEQIATDELRHHHFYQEYTQRDVNPNRWKIFKFYWSARIFGLTFSLKLMEKGEERSKNLYREVSAEIQLSKKSPKKKINMKMSFLTSLKRSVLII